MAKFCGNCGNQLDDTARVCGYCGMQLDDTPQPIAGIDYSNSVKKNNSGKIVKLVVIFAVVAGILFGGIKIVTGFTGYNGLVRKVMKAYERYDIDSLIDMSSDVYFYGSEDYAQYYFEYCVGEDLDYYENTVGHNYKFSYKVDETYKLSERKMSELEEGVQEIYEGFDLDMFEKVVIADLKVTVEKGGKSVNRDVVLTLTKESGEWRLLYIE